MSRGAGSDEHGLLVDEEMKGGSDPEEARRELGRSLEPSIFPAVPTGRG